jgi:hypothetical protein
MPLKVLGSRGAARGGLARQHSNHSASAVGFDGETSQTSRRPSVASSRPGFRFASTISGTERLAKMPAVDRLRLLRRRALAAEKA